jgi:hypothetical protein
MRNDAIPSGRQLDTKMMDAWREAAEELAIHVEVPFTLTTSAGKTEVYCGVQTVALQSVGVVLDSPIRHFGRTRVRGYLVNAQQEPVEGAGITRYSLSISGRSCAGMARRSSR